MVMNINFVGKNRYKSNMNKSILLDKKVKDKKYIIYTTVVFSST